MLLFDTILSAFAPHSCLSCRKEGALLCPDCGDALAYPLASCSLCGAVSASGIVCNECCNNNNIISVSAAAAYEGYARQLVRCLKFERAIAAADIVATIMVRRLTMAGRTVIYVPTATTRVRVRGYDQAQRIALSYAKQAGFPMANLLIRTGQQRQVGKTRYERQRQLRSAFQVRPLPLAYNTPLLLIDDVFTTGSSIVAASSALKEAGYTNIKAAVFAVA